MLYLASSQVADVKAAVAAGHLGALAAPQGGTPRAPGRPWAADNGCYTLGDRFDLDQYLAWLGRQPRDDCLFATAPDVVGDAAATWVRSAPVLPAIRALGFPAALVAQDGLELLDVDWPAFDALFIGGTTAWKLGPAAARLASAAKAAGKHVHMGRVNSLRRLRYAQAIGCDSADGTYLSFGPAENLPKLLGWVRDVTTQTFMPWDP